MDRTYPEEGEGKRHKNGHGLESSAGKRKRGRPKQSWRPRVIKELENIGRMWGEMKRIANNRVRWKAMLEALCLLTGKEV